MSRRMEDAQAGIEDLVALLQDDVGLRQGPVEGLEEAWIAQGPEHGEILPVARFAQEDGVLAMNGAAQLDSALRVERDVVRRAGGMVEMAVGEDDPGGLDAALSEILGQGPPVLGRIDDDRPLPAARARVNVKIAIRS